MQWEMVFTILGTDVVAVLVDSGVLSDNIEEVLSDKFINFRKRLTASCTLIVFILACVDWYEQVWEIIIQVTVWQF